MHTHTASSSSSSSTSSLFSSTSSQSSSASTSTSSLLMASSPCSSPPPGASNNAIHNTLESHLEFHGYKKAKHGLWFDDGTLVLVAQDTAFRIYRGLLCQRSSVFADMFAFPPPKEGNDIVEGVPVVQSFDSALDMTMFLRALLDSQFFEPPPSPTSITILESILRLSTKYDVPHLRSRAQAHLLTTYPTSLSAWRARDSTRTIPSLENTPFIVLNLAREFDMPWLVPSVAYCISSHDISKTLDGAEWRLESQAKVPRGQRGRDPRGPVRRASTASTSTSLSSSTSSSTSSGSDASSSASSGSSGTGATDVDEEGEDEGWCRLSWSDVKMCIKGRNNILLKQNNMALQIAKGFPTPSPSPAATPAGVATPVPVAIPIANPVPNAVPIQVQAPIAVQPAVPVHVLAQPQAPVQLPMQHVQIPGGVQTPNAAPQNPNPFNGVLPALPAPPAQAQILAQVQHVMQMNMHLPPAPAPATVTGVQRAAGGGCSTPEACAHTRHRCAEMLTRWGTAGFLDFFDEQYTAFAPNLCPTCVTSMKTWCKDKSEEMWDALPRCFGFAEGEVTTGAGQVVRLSAWEELERVRGLGS